MTINKIFLTCTKCGCKKSDVLAKNYTHGKTVIQTKCLSCGHNHFLKEDDQRCEKFFK